MANYLKNMTIMEISLVDEPACPDADVILMKRNADLVGEVVELLKREESALDEAIALLEKRDDASEGDDEAHDVSEEPRDERGRWTRAVATGGKLARQAMLASKKVASTVVSTVRGGVRAVRATGLTEVHPVEGGGVQFDFEHEYVDGAKLLTRAQIRPEHVAFNRNASDALSTLHHALKNNGKEMQPSFGFAPPRAYSDNSAYYDLSNRLEPAPFLPEGNYTPKKPSGLASVIRWKHEGSPQLFASTQAGQQSAVSAGATPTSSGAASTNSLTNPTATGPNSPNARPFPSRDRLESGLPTYQWFGTQTPTDAADIQRRGRDLGATSYETAGGLSYTTRRGVFVPAVRPDVQAHIEHVQNWVSSNGEKGIAAKNALTYDSPLQAGGVGHFTRAGDYIPAAPQSTQFQFARDYRDERQRRESKVAPLFNNTPTELTLPLHVTEPGPGDHAPDFAREPMARSLRLDPSEIESVADHFSTKRPGELTDVQRHLSSRAVDAYNNVAPHLDISEEEAGHLDRSMEAHPPKSFDRKKLHERVQNFLIRKRHVRAILTQKIKG